MRHLLANLSYVGKCAVGVDERSEIFILQKIERGFSERVKLSRLGVRRFSRKLSGLTFLFLFSLRKKEGKNEIDLLSEL